MCEPILLKHSNKNFEGVIFRPATVCGYSPRMRLDLSVNILTNFAYNKGFINVFGGNQLRPNLHILDYCDAVIELIEAPSEKIYNQIFNVGHQNMSILNLAKRVKKIIFNKTLKKIKLIKTSSNDKRSYHINSDKIKNIIGFSPKRNVDDAILEVYNAFKKKKIPNSFTNLNYYNVKKMLKLKVK